MFSIQYAKMKKLLFSETVNADFLIDNLETKYCENLLNPKWINDIKVLFLQNTKSERMNVVSIPYVPREERIGSVFNELFRVINETENYRGAEIVWDFLCCQVTHIIVMTIIPILFMSKSPNR